MFELSGAQTRAPVAASRPKPSDHGSWVGKSKVEALTSTAPITSYFATRGFRTFFKESIMRTLTIPCTGYSVTADIYEGSDNGAVALWLIGRTSRRSKEHYRTLLPELSEKQGLTSVIFDYSGHGDSPFDIEHISPAQHFLEVITVFDWIRTHYPGKKLAVIGSSYGGFLATQLTKYREFDALVLRAPAIYKPSDFYTAKKDEDRQATQDFRRNVKLLSNHPLLARASRFTGKSLLIVHENDEQIPPQTTDAYANAFKPEVIVAKGISHSLDSATTQQVGSYNQALYDWLKSAF